MNGLTLNDRIRHVRNRATACRAAAAAGAALALASAGSLAASVPGPSGFAQVNVFGKGIVPAGLFQTASDSGGAGIASASSGTVPAPFVSASADGNTGNLNAITGAYAELGYYFSVPGPVGQTLPMQVTAFGKVTLAGGLSSASASMVINNDTLGTMLVFRQACIDPALAACGVALERSWTLDNFSFDIRFNDRIYVGLIARASAIAQEETTALVDPVFRINPAFAGASQYDILFSDGITQPDAATAVVPLPGSSWLLAGGAMLLAAGARRRTGATRAR